MRSFALVLLAVVACGPKLPAEAPPPTPQPVPAPDDARTAPPPVATPTLEAPIGILACDEYLTLYRECEPSLEPEIQAGDRRSYRAERGWIEYMRDTPEGQGLAAACRDMHQALIQVCASGD